MRTLLRTVLVVCVLVLFAAAVDGQKPQPALQPSPCGRFQLFQGRVGIDMGGQNGVLARDVIARIDTQTGNAWVYAWGADKSIPEGWVAVAELPRVTWAPAAQPPQP